MSYKPVGRTRLNFTSPSYATFDSFAGVDYLHSLTEMVSSRTNYAPNMDCSELGSIERRVGYRDLYTLTTAHMISILWMAQVTDKTDSDISYLLYASYIGGAFATLKIYRALITSTGLDTPTALWSETSLGFYSKDITSFYHDGDLYILTGRGYFKYNGTTVTKVDGYVPTTAIACDHLGAGTFNEYYNLLSTKIKKTYITDGSATYYTDEDASAVTSVILNGSETFGSGATYNDTTKRVTFPSTIAAPTDGEPNLVIYISTSRTSQSTNITNCTISTTYGLGNDNRYMVAGNPDKPNYEWISAIDDPTYFPDDGTASYFKVGDSSNAIMGFLKVNDALAIVKGDANNDSTVFLQTAELSDAVYNYDGDIIKAVSTQFPILEGVRVDGAISKKSFETLDGEPLYLSKNGVKAIISSAITDTRSVQSRSQLIDTALTAEDLSTAVSIVFKDKLYLAVGDDVYVADSRKKYNTETETSATGYEWYHWTGIGVTAWAIVNDELWFARAIASGDTDNPYFPIICRFNTDIDGDEKYNDNGNAFFSAWTLPMMDFDNFMRKKDIMKKGTGFLMEQGDKCSAIIAFSENGEDFDEVGETVYDADKDGDKFAVAIGAEARLSGVLTFQMRIQNDAINEKFKILKGQVAYKNKGMTGGSTL